MTSKRLLSLPCQSKPSTRSNPPLSLSTQTSTLPYCVRRLGAVRRSFQAERRLDAVVALNDRARPVQEPQREILVGQV